MQCGPPLLYRIVVCALTPVMRAAGCQRYGSAVEGRRVAALRVCPSLHSLAVCNCCVVAVVVAAAAVVVAVVSERMLTCTYLASLSCCDFRGRRSVAGMCGGMTASGTCRLSGCVAWGPLAHGVVRER